MPQGATVTIAHDGSFNAGYFPSVAMDADGDYVVAWEEYSDALFSPRRFDIMAQRFDAVGTAQGDAFHANAGASETQVHTFPAVAIDRDGDFVVSWELVTYLTPKVRRLQARLFDSQGNPRGNEFDVTADAPRDVAPDVAMDALGAYAIAWNAPSPNGIGNSIYARRASGPTVGPGAVFIVNTTPAGDQRPSISMDAAGESVVTWTASSVVMGQQFTAAGAKDGAEFRLDTSATPSASGASVAMDYDGDFVAAWTRSQGDVDVYARVYSSPQGRNSASGQVFQDLDGDGAKDPGEGGMAGFVVYHDANNNGQLDSGALTGPSPAALTPLPPIGTRRYIGPAAFPAASGKVIRDVNVTINLQHPNDSDLTASLVSPAGTRAELFSRIGATGDNFSNTTFDDSSPVPITLGLAPFTGTYRTQNQTLSRFNSERLTDDGYWMLEIRNDGGNAGYVFNWSVTVSYSEDSTVSDAAGNYSLSLPPGASTVREVQQSGWVQSAPPGGAHSVSFPGGGQSTGGLDFGNTYPGTVSGGVFHDINANGINEAGEGLLGGWTVFADLNGNGQMDSGEPSSVSNPLVGYQLRGVPLNRPVSLAALAPPTTGAPWQISVAPGPVNLTITQPGASLQNFGGFRAGSISGVKFNDLNGNGSREPAEPGLAGWTIYLDRNGNGQLDGVPLTTRSRGTPAPIAAGREPLLSDVSVQGQAGPVIDVNVTLNVTHEDLSGLAVVLISPAGTRVQLFIALPRRSANLNGTTFDDQAAQNIIDGAAPYDGSFAPVQPLASFNGEDANGKWTLEVTNSSRIAGSLDSWSMTVTTPAEPFAVTNAAGQYLFPSLHPGTYAVREQSQPAWSQTLPVGGLYVRTLNSGQDVTDLDFGNHPAGAAPTVTHVYAAGTAWSPAFSNYLGSQSLGVPQFGFSIGAGAGQLATLPWTNVNQISISFSGDVQVDQSDLSVRGVNVASYPTAAFVYSPADHTATWTFPQSFARDKVLLDLDGNSPAGVRGAGPGGQLLDGEWTTGGNFPSGNGAAGGDFKFRFNMLPGDVNRSGSVLADDFSAVKSRFFRSTAAPGSGASAYNVLDDVDGSSSILANDFSAVKSRFFQTLPGAEPAVSLDSPAGGAVALLLPSA